MKIAVLNIGGFEKAMRVKELLPRMEFIDFTLNANVANDLDAYRKVEKNWLVFQLMETTDKGQKGYYKFIGKE